MSSRFSVAVAAGLRKRARGAGLVGPDPGGEEDEREQERNRGATPAAAYEDLRHPAQMRTPEFIRAGFEAELDKVTVWPDQDAQTRRAA